MPPGAIVAKNSHVRSGVAAEVDVPTDTFLGADLHSHGAAINYGLLNTADGLQHGLCPYGVPHGVWSIAWPMVYSMAYDVQDSTWPTAWPMAYSMVHGL